MTISSLAFAVMYILAKQLSYYSGYQLTFFRGLGTFVLAAGYLLMKGIPLAGHQPRLLWSRGITGSLSLLLFFIALAYVPVTAAVAIRYLSPFFAILITMVWLREKVKPIQWLFLVIAFIGVVMLKGFDGRIELLGLTLILASAALGGITFSIIRALGTSEHPLVIVCYFTGCATILGAAGMLLLPGAWSLPAKQDWVPLLCLGVVGLVGQLFMTIAMQIEVASKTMPLKYLETVFLLVLSYFFLDEVYSLWALVGMVLIIGGNLVNALAR